MKTSGHESKVAKSSTGYYVGRFFQEDEVITQFTPLTDNFRANKKPSRLESIMEKVTERRGTEFSLFF
ncbi:hypothetical protein [Bacillus sp. EB600]|uniref:hypothetical protein n=1 Tax=Bacillus sp. EB600 TaxID=2806345 RepID=UPI00210C2964|nr:hypothetical protein [Bacillus sp. EB600]MCQ6280816.1 hypothetical protein [Bacillus sp. EB600]